MTISEEIHCVCVTARRHCPCTWCGAHPGQPCDCPGGMHLRRIVTARLAGHVSEEDTGMAFAWAGIFTESTVVTDDGAALEGAA